MAIDKRTQNLYKTEIISPMLANLRMGGSNEAITLHQVAEVRKLLKEVQLKPKNIGTSEAELRRWEVKAWKGRAEKALLMLRSPQYYDSSQKRLNQLYMLRNSLAQAGLGLENVGTTKEEVAQWEKEIFTNLLAPGRQGHFSPALLWVVRGDLPRYLELSKLTPEDIGTSEAEVKELEGKCWKAEVPVIISKMRRGTPYIQHSNPNFDLALLKEHLMESKLTPEEAGIGKEEMIEFERQAKISRES